ncbi:hypothetical protein Pcac1_g225 [Phytophthora cactorum]|uniref:Uncharacterized protein n=1 Tax=Phytophthora cactorum TaxID=29920 RepID=A0A8T1D5H5_9STRA|nr:hypothetical protein Pcac1_g225 [Phytophthora cactorum]KAG2935111.1 hypothetical protein PC117_g12476 [Phytophthora cactorum]KAG3182433.1 hypothetical protein PC128_g14684 [Phytophthora cactorum]
MEFDSSFATGSGSPANLELAVNTRCVHWRAGT